MLRTSVGARGTLTLLLCSIFALSGCTRLLPAAVEDLDGGSDVARRDLTKSDLDSSAAPADLDSAVLVDVGADARLDLAPSGPSVVSYSASQSVALGGLVAMADGTMHVAGGYRGDLRLGTRLFPSAAPNFVGYLISFSAKAAPAVETYAASKQCYVQDLTVDDQGRLYAGGIAHGTVTFGGVLGQHVTGSHQEAFVLALDGTQKPRWLRSYEGSQNYQLHALSWHVTSGLAAGGLYRTNVPASFGQLSLPASVPYDDPFVLGLSSAGAEAWVYGIDAQGFSTVFAVAHRADGGVCVTGQVDGAVDLGSQTVPSNGGKDLFVAALDEKGKPLWWRRFGAAGNDRGLAAVAVGDDCVFAGELSGTADLGGGVMLPHLGKSDAFVARYSATAGVHLWSRTFGAAKDDGALGMTLDGQNLYVVGSFHDTITIGGFSLKSAGERDALLLTLDPATGAPKAAQREGGVGADAFTHVAVEPGSGRLIAAGSFTGAITILGQQLSTVDPQGIFVVRYP